MDNTPEGIAPQEITTLSYDDDVAYEAQLPSEAELAASASLANRISKSKVYLLSESSAAANRPPSGKRKHDDEEEGQGDIDEDMNEDDPVYRTNALLLQGSPIEHLPTARIFAYATHFDAHPMGLEWVDDNTCVLVFKSRKEALEGFTRLQKSASEEPEEDDCTTARPFPVALWPPEERINETLGQGHGLKGPIRMRWAKRDDVKKRGAMRESNFYRRHGSSAGKELFNGRDLPPAKRRRNDDYRDDDARRAELDDELDRFLAEENSEGEKQPDTDRQSPDADEYPPSPPSKMRSDYLVKDGSKMRSDYIGNDGRTLLERTSLLRLHNTGANEGNERPDLASRLTAPLPRRSRQRRRGRDGDEFDELPPNLDSKALESLGDRLQPRTTEKLEWGPGTGDGSRRDDRSSHDEIRIFGASNGSVGGGERPRRARGGQRERERRRHERPAPGERIGERPKKTQQELDDELDAFLRAS